MDGGVIAWTVREPRRGRTSPYRNVVHSRSRTIEIEWLEREGRVQVAVKDEGVFLPEDEMVGRAPTAGLGFALMHGTVDRVMVEPGTAQKPGTIVWLEKSLRDGRILESA